MVPGSPKHGQWKNPRSAGASGGVAAPTPHPSTSRGRARQAMCLATWVVRPARSTPRPRPPPPATSGRRRPVADDGETDESDGRHLRRPEQRQAVREHADLVRDEVPEHEVVEQLVGRDRGREDRERENRRLDQASALKLPDHGR